jgi:hypothetical protein
MSVAAGIGCAFMRDGIDPTLRSGSDAEHLTGVPLLAEVQS